MRSTLLIGLALLAGCGNVYAPQWATAENACAQHGGVRSVSADTLTKWTAARCNDGTYIETRTKEAPE